MKDWYKLIFSEPRETSDRPQPLSLPSRKRGTLPPSKDLGTFMRTKMFSKGMPLLGKPSGEILLELLES